MLDLKTPRILWEAIALSSVALLVLLNVKRPTPNAPLEPIMVVGIAAVALIDAISSFVVPAILFKKAVATVEVDVVREAASDPSAVSSYRNAPTRRVFADAKGAMRIALLTFQRPFILSLALTESIAMLGFILGFLGHPRPTYLPFFVVSWLLFLPRFPTRAAVLGRFERAKDAVFP